MLAYAASDQSRYQDAMDYVIAALMIRSDHFQLAWIALDLIKQDENIRSEFEALVQPGGKFATTLFGRFLARMLRYRPMDDYEKLAVVEYWLKERPFDAKALRFKAQTLKNLERYEEADLVLEESTALYPFTYFHRWMDHPIGLLGSGDYDKARKVVAQMATLRSKNGAALALTEQYLAEALDSGVTVFDKRESRSAIGLPCESCFENS